MLLSFAILRRVLACVLVAGLVAGASSDVSRSGITTVRAPSIGIVWLSTSGNDATCVRNDSLRPCASFGRSYQVAHSGDWVLVGAGTYPVTDPSAGATTIFADPSKGGTVSFACLGDGAVTFAASNFTFYPGVGGVAMHGSCFRFHVVHFGYGGSPPPAQSITLDGVHMDSFECAGCSNVTIENSEVGPAVACWAPGSSGNGGNGIPIPPTSWCDPNDPVQGYLATQPGGSANQQMEPYIHNNVAVFPTNVALIHNHFHAMQTKDSGNLHTGGLLIWNVHGLLLRERPRPPASREHVRPQCRL
jgi:hypothetical protein